MKKNVLIVTTSVLLFISASAAITAAKPSWIKVSDSCNKCVMNNIDRICGKCGGFMAGVDGTTKVESDGYIKSTYKCKKCGHTIIYKNK